MKKNLCIIIFISFLCLSCSTSKDEKKTLPARLNGNNYSSPYNGKSADINFFGKEKFKNTLISGHVFRIIKDNKIPFRKGEMFLKKDGNQLGTSLISHDGSFSISAKIPDGFYHLVFEGYKKEIKVSGFDIDKIEFLIEN